MRKLVGLFGALCCVVVIALVARFAYKTADNDVDGLINAFMYATIAAGGLGGHAVALRVWKKSWVWGFLIGLVAAAALAVNISNSLGAIAGRGDAKSAERLKQAQVARDLRRDLERLTKERETLPAFQVTSVEAVRAARDEVDIAAKRTEPDCSRGYNSCTRLRDTEQQKRAALTRVITERAATERADKLDAEIKDVREKLAKAQPVQAQNAQATALARLFGMVEGEQGSIIYFQYLAVSIIVELLIVGALVGYELLGEPQPQQAQTASETREAARDTSRDLGRDAARDSRRDDKAKAAPKASPVVDKVERKELAPPTPALPKSEPKTAKPKGNTEAIAEFAVERLSPANGEATPLELVFASYSAWCADRAVAAVDRAEFEHWFRTIGKEIGITIVVRGDSMLCRNVKIAA